MNIIQEKNVKKRDFGIDCLKALCAIGIVIYHFYGASFSDVKLLYRHQNGFFGVTFVTIFFMASGYVLFMLYPQINNIKAFYKKRWLAIFPAFYLLYIYYFVEQIFEKKAVFYKGSLNILVR